MVSLSLFLLTVLAQSTVVLLLGLAVGSFVGASRAALQSVIYRTTLASVILCPAITLFLPVAIGPKLAISLSSSTGPMAMPRQEVVASEEPVSSNPRTDSLVTGEASTGDLSEPAPLATEPTAFSETPVMEIPAPTEISPALPASAPETPLTRRTIQSNTLDLQSGHAAWLGGLATSFVLLWLMGVIFLAFRWGMAVLSFKRKRNGIVPIDHTERRRYKAMAQKLGCRLPPVYRAPFVTSPCLVGIWRPVILLPADDESVSPHDSVIAHELAHLQRRDTLWLTIAQAATIFLWCQPLLWRLRRRLAKSAEEVCDDYVLKLGLSPFDYADRLAEIASAYCTKAPNPLVAVCGRRSGLFDRVERILDASRELSVDTKRSTRTIVGIFFLATALLMGIFQLQGPAEEAESLSESTSTTEKENRSEQNDPDTTAFEKLLAVRDSYLEKRRAEGRPVDPELIEAVTAFIEPGGDPLKVRQDVAQLLRFSGSTDGKAIAMLLAPFCEYSSENQMVERRMREKASGVLVSLPPEHSLPLLREAAEVLKDRGGKEEFHSLAGTIEYIERCQRHRRDWEDEFTLHVQDERGNPLPEAKVLVSIVHSQLGHNRTHIVDSKGDLEIRLPNTHDMAALQLMTSAPGHVGQAVSWNFEQPGFTIPQEYTLTLPSGISIGGVVRNEEGEPIPEVEIGITCYAEDIPSSGRLENGVPEPFASTMVTTDENGRWNIDSIPENGRDFQLHLTHPEYVSSLHLRDSRFYKVEDFLNGSGELIMERGTVLRGKVTREDGTPIAGAVILMGKERHSNAYGTEVMTDEQGRYHFSPLKAETRELFTVVAPGFAPQQKRILLYREMPPVDFVMKPGRTLSLQAVDVQGHPLDNAQVYVKEWKGSNILSEGFGIYPLNLPKMTDNQGRWSWSWAPEEAFELRIYKEGYRQGSITFFNSEIASNADACPKVTLEPNSSVKLVVTDSETGKPIPRITIIEGSVSSDSDETVSWQTFNPTSKESEDGVYRWTLPRRQSQDSSYTGYVLLHAEGYAPSMFSVTPNTSVNGTLALERTKKYEGILLAPDGSIEPYADLRIAVPKTSIGIHKDEFIPSRDGYHMWGIVQEVSTDEEGRFSFNASKSQSFHVTAVSENGYLIAPKIVLLANRGELQLRPWGKIEGRLLFGTEPGVGEEIAVVRNIEYDGDLDDLLYSEPVSTRTDQEGRFAFDRLVDGNTSVSRVIRFLPDDRADPPLYDARLAQTQKLLVTSGTTRNVVLGGQGRPVRGTLVLPEELLARFSRKSLEWKNAFVELTPEWLHVPLSDEERVWPRGSSISQTESGRRYAETRELRQTKIRMATVSEDEGLRGSFRVENVPPGKYVLEAYLLVPPHIKAGVGGAYYTSLPPPEVRYAQVVRQIEVPPTDDLNEPHDLGEIVMEISSAFEAGSEVSEVDE